MKILRGLAHARKARAFKHRVRAHQLAARAEAKAAELHFGTVQQAREYLENPAARTGPIASHQQKEGK
jgi:hypothetical protein